MSKANFLETQIFEAITKTRRQCKNCGAKYSFLYSRKTYAICYRCGHRIYKSDKLEFKEKLKKELRKNGT